MFYTPTILNMILFSVIQGAVFFGLAVLAGPVVAVTAFIAFPLGMIFANYLNK
jgi:hypothetical protein